MHKAQRCYLQALEFSWQMEDVDNLFVPDGEAETLKHARFLEEHGVRGDELSDNRLFLSSKVVAVLSGNEGLDSHHHGTIVDLWALCNAFAFDVIIWRVPDNQYYSARSQKVLSSAEAAETLRRQPATVLLVHQDIGKVGHFSLVRPQHRLVLPETPWLSIYDEHGPLGVQQLLDLYQ